MRSSFWKRIGVAAPVAGVLAAFGVLAVQAVNTGSGTTNLPVPSGMSVAVARGVEPYTMPTTAKAETLAVDMNHWQETNAQATGERGSRGRRF